MRTLAIGDIHGCSVALHALLDAVAPQPDDVLISLGDVIDRGPDSRGVLDFLIDLYAGGRLVVLRGNHEQMMLDARGLPDAWLMWLACGGRQAVASYPGIVGDTFEPSKIPEAHWKFLDENLLDCCETATHFFVHGNVYFDIPLDEQPWDMLRWEQFNMPLPHVSGKLMVCGHTRQRSGRPYSVGHAVCIDTGVYADDGWLTCLEVEKNRYWQANQRGEVRSDYLDPPLKCPD